MIDPPVKGAPAPCPDDAPVDGAVLPGSRRADGQELPDVDLFLPTESESPEVSAGPWTPAGWRRFAEETAIAVAKSMEIGAGGARVLNAALFACAWMSVDDAFTAHRSRLSCRSIFGLLRLERDLAPRALADLTIRNAVLGRICVQIGQDAAYPLYQRAALAFDWLSRHPASPER